MTEPKQLEVPARAWESACRHADRGNAKHLLDMLLRPAEVGRGDGPLAWNALPADAELRLRIVGTLIFTIGRWKRAHDFADLMNLEGFTKDGATPRLADIAVDVAALDMVLSQGQAVRDARGRGEENPERWAEIAEEARLRRLDEHAKMHQREPETLEGRIKERQTPGAGGAKKSKRRKE